MQRLLATGFEAGAFSIVYDLLIEGLKSGLFRLSSTPDPLVLKKLAVASSLLAKGSSK